MKCYIFDVDGTLADLTHRLHFIRNEGKKDWNSFKHFCFADKPIPHMIDMARILYWSGRAGRHDYGYEGPEWEVILMSGRNECQRDMTEEWLEKVACLPFHSLYMRADEDYRPDHVIKLELLQKVKQDGFEPIMAFDDRNQVVNMWRAAGIPCAQVAEGNF